MGLLACSVPQISGFKSPSLVVGSSDTAGWMCAARRIILHDALASMRSMVE